VHMHKVSSEEAFHNDKKLSGVWREITFRYEQLPFLQMGTSDLNCSIHGIYNYVDPRIRTMSYM
jgi:hypothetical protein